MKAVIRNGWFWGVGGAAVTGMLTLFILANADAERAKYITWDSLEPDIWASVWIIKHHIASDAEIVIRPVGAPVSDGIAFGMDEAQYKRNSDGSVYESLLKADQTGNVTLQKLGKIIHDIEISPWANPVMQESPVVEQAFRTLQDQFENRAVPAECYGKFFDITYQLLTENKPYNEWQALSDFAGSHDACGDSGQLATRDDRPFVRRVDAQLVLDTIGAGKKVIFVDAREEVEYNEYHIPGAIRMSLQDVNKDVLPQFEGAALVIGYCIKDFRGFELARSLAEVGVKNAATMKPYGISGWMAAKLPTTGIDGLTEQAAKEMLMDCATGARKCL